MFSANHAWIGIDAQNETFTLVLTVSDGANIGTKTVDVVVNNRLPVQIEAGPITTVTQTATVMPFVPEDQMDHRVVELVLPRRRAPRFRRGRPNQRLQQRGGHHPQPVVAERAGTYSVDVTVIDDDGGSSVATSRSSSRTSAPPPPSCSRGASSSETWTFEHRHSTGRPTCSTHGTAPIRTACG